MKRLLYITTTVLLMALAISCSEDEPYEYGDFRFDMVTFTGFDAVTDSLRFTSRPDSVVMDSVRLKSIWRTGNYLNLSTEVKFTEGKRQLYLVMDKATWHSDTVRAYLAHNMLGEQAYFWRKCYLSFYIGAVWKLQSCKVLRAVSYTHLRAHET